MDAPNATVVWTVRLTLILEQNSLKFHKVSYILIRVISSGENFFSQYISTWIYENRVSKFLSTPHVLACLLWCLLMSHLYFGSFVVRDLWRFGCTQNFGKFAYFLATPPPPLPPSLEGVFPSLPRILCLTQVTVIEASARLKLVLAPFSSLYFVIGHLEKSFPESIMQSSQMDKINTIRRVYIVQYRIVFWFHLAKRINHPSLFAFLEWH